jgi:hypothetical protein
LKALAMQSNSWSGLVDAPEKATIRIKRGG